jgi:hypothetical protein
MIFSLSQEKKKSENGSNTALNLTLGDLATVLVKCGWVGE